MEKANVSTEEKVRIASEFIVSGESHGNDWEGDFWRM
jgi:hypothetical protein